MAGTTPDTNALTLSEYANQSNDPLIQAITYSLHQTNNLLQDVPLLNRKSLVMNGSRFVDNLPGVNWGQLNQVPTVTKGKPTQFQEGLYLVRNQFQIDSKLQDTENWIEDPLDTQIKAYMKSFAYDFNYKLINNGRGGTNDDANAPLGLRFRLDNPTQFKIPTEMKIDAGGVDISATGVTSTTANNFLSLIEEMFDFMGGASTGEGCVLYVNDYLKRAFSRALRTVTAGGGFTTDKDNYDRPVEKYRSAVIRDVGRKVDQVTRIISQTETAGGADGASNYTSAYAVRYGKDSFCGWQYEPLKPKSLGLDPTNGVTFNTVIDWAFGLWQQDVRAVARLYDIKIS